jgi:hypothetical protein
MKKQVLLREFFSPWGARSVARALLDTIGVLGRFGPGFRELRVGDGNGPNGGMHGSAHDTKAGWYLQTFGFTPPVNAHAHRGIIRCEVEG